jgi:pyrimidine and pyridine-specific 5'-nucleotidase
MSVNGTLEDPRMVIWFDIDNTLYSASTKISHAMGQRIHAYFVSLGLDEDEASELHLKYYRQYGLALRGLMRHHDIDPLDFDQKCDGTLPLEDCIKPDLKLRKLFEDLDGTKSARDLECPRSNRRTRLLRLRATKLYLQARTRVLS